MLDNLSDCLMDFNVSLDGHATSRTSLGDIRYLATNGAGSDYLSMKRSISVTVKMTEQDVKMLEKAAAAIWPGAILTRSSIVLGLARLGAETRKPKG